jgi:DNA-binding IclR family transcriptional regulator
MPELNQVKMDAFVGKMVGIVNHAALALMTSVGRQTGLFEAMAMLPPSTSTDIARAARLHERYVREWLGAMVTGGVVEYEPAAATYTLPPEHAAALTNAAGPRNLARFTQFIPLLAEVEAEIGDRVSFQPSGHPILVGMLTRYNKKTVTVITDSGQRWNLAPAFLRRPEQARPADDDAPNVIRLHKK